MLSPGTVTLTILVPINLQLKKRFWVPRAEEIESSTESRVCSFLGRGEPRGPGTKSCWGGSCFWPAVMLCWGL